MLPTLVDGATIVDGIPFDICLQETLGSLQGGYRRIAIDIDTPSRFLKTTVRREQ